MIILYNIYMYTHGGRSEVFKRVPCELIRNRRTNSPRRVRGSICSCAGRSRRGVVSSPSRLSSWGAGCAGCEINPGSARALQEPQRNPRSPIAQRNMREGGTSAGALSQFSIIFWGGGHIQIFATATFADRGGSRILLPFRGFGCPDRGGSFNVRRCCTHLTSTWTRSLAVYVFPRGRPENAVLFDARGDALAETRIQVYSGVQLPDCC